MEPFKEEAIRLSFQKVKEDILNLKQELESLRQGINYLTLSIKSTKISQVDELNQPIFTSDRQIIRQTDNQTDTSTHNPTQQTQNSTFRHINSTEKPTSTHSSTDNLPNKGLKGQNITFSTGNEGVSTDRQTIRQTDTSTGNEGVKSTINLQNTSFNSSFLLNQLDSFQKDIRLKVKRLTNQEVIVLSSIYQLDSQGFIVDYPLLSSKLNLTESSIRDYVQRITSKGFPLTKEKINNKKVVLHISQDFKQLISLDTLLKLRDL